MLTNVSLLCFMTQKRRVNFFFYLVVHKKSKLIACFTYKSIAIVLFVIFQECFIILQFKERMNEHLISILTFKKGSFSGLAWATPSPPSMVQEVHQVGIVATTLTHKLKYHGYKQSYNGMSRCLPRSIKKTD